MPRDGDLPKGERTPLARIRDASIRTKLIAILLLPMIGLVCLASVGIGTSLARSIDAERARERAAFAFKVTALVDQLQQERMLSAVVAVTGKRADVAKLADRRRNVNRSVQAFKAARAALPQRVTQEGFGAEVSSVISDLGQLASQRKAVDARVPIERVLGSYTQTIDGLLRLITSVADGVDSASISARARAFTALAELKETTARHGALLASVFAANHVSPGQARQAAELAGQQRVWMAQFEQMATAHQRGLLTSSLSTPDVAKVDRLQTAAFERQGAPKLDIDPNVWANATAANLELLGKVQTKVADDLSRAADAVKTTADRQQVVFGGVITLIVIITVVGGTLAARSMIMPLQRLRDAANVVAGRKLHGLVERLQRGEPVSIEKESTPIRVQAWDEIGEVTEAFNAVQDTAIRVAALQASLRKSIRDMFVNMAWRNQSLIDRQISLITALEHKETDPDELAELFQLDHLATRLRRNAENLIVLYGTHPSRRFTQPVALLQVVEAAVGEVEDYTRVEILNIDEVAVSGQVANDITHLLAELLENATSFSPPGTKVQVAGQPVTAGYVVEIEDRGVGMTDEELVEANQRLARPSEVDFALSRMLGFFVVGRLAARHGIRVQLRHSWYGGVTALLLLPNGLLTQIESPGKPAATKTSGEAPALASTNGGHDRPALNGASTTSENRRPDRLPIFEAARSDWFGHSPGTTTHLPLRPHAAAGAERPPLAKPVTSDQDSAAAPNDSTGMAAQQSPEGMPSDPLESTVSSSSTASMTPPAASGLTSAGLPRRMPRANLHSEAAEAVSTDSDGAPRVPPRSPDQMRDLLVDYQAGVARGRQEVGGPTRPPEARSPLFQPHDEEPR